MRYRTIPEMANPPRLLSPAARGDMPCGRDPLR